MNTLADDLRRIILSVSAQPRRTAATTLKGVPGRGPNGFGARFKSWLESGPQAFSEPITVECVDHMSDHGVDVLITGLRTGTRIGVQIKSDNDIAEGFTAKTKAQLTDAQAWSLSEILLLLACQPTDKNEKVYLHLFNELQRWPRQEIFICLPERSAAVFAAFGAPMVPPARSRTWPELAAKLARSDITAALLDRWPTLPPTSRFIAPREFTAMVDSLDLNPVTIISGPPASGKTFSAIQLLMHAFEAGREPVWIAPATFQSTSGPLAELSAPPDLKTRIDQLTRTLGVRPRLRPLDAAEFAAVHLRPTSAVFIEDPFGQTDDAYTYSLHTYDFFDLDVFIDMLGQGKPRAGCRIIITTREGLLDRWMEERRAKGPGLPSGVELIRIGPGSYYPRAIHDLTSKLLVESKAPISAAIVDEAADQLASPYEVELVAYAAAGGTAPLVALNDYKEGLRKALSGRLLPADDGERLFLLILAALASNGHWKNDFGAAFLALHTAIVGADGSSALGSCLTKFRVFFARYDGGTKLGSHRWFHLEPIHSTVRDEIKGLLSALPDFLEAVACALPALVEPLFSITPATVGIYLLSLGAAQKVGKAADAIVTVLLTLSNSGQAYPLAGVWGTLDQSVRELILTGLEQKPAFLPELVAACGTKASTLPSADAWRVTRALLSTNLGAQRRWPHSHPWAFMFKNLSSMPADLRASLDAIASSRPELLAFAFGDAIVEYWDSSPESWRTALEAPEALHAALAQRRVLPTVLRQWPDAPQRVKALALAGAKSPDRQIRAVLGTWALIEYEHAPDDFTPILHGIADDSELRVPFEVISEGAGDDKHDQDFVERVAARVQGLPAAALLSRVAAPYKPLSAWRLTVARTCLGRGGGLARAVTIARGKTSRLATDLAVQFTDLANEPEEVRCAVIWAFANDGRESSAEEAVDLTRKLTGLARDVALWALANQAHFLPDSVKQFLNSEECAGATDQKAITEGRATAAADQRGPLELPSRTLREFPVDVFVPELADSSS